LRRPTSVYVFDNLERARDRVHGIEQAEYRKLVETFMQRLLNRQTAHPWDSLVIEEVWASWEPELEVTVIVRERDLATDLQLRMLFRDAASTTQDPACGDLRIALAPFEPVDAELIYSVR
jgi:hypothetical protein